ncbi:hypothetical protein U9M48_041494 [Paspalum notatum var. saurae]|uniref:Uncharacterized protein n=1 Tax=Paspalum notatum var. saurae TaxID=547442 RepID=A0AAQ3XFB5_PASNO
MGFESISPLPDHAVDKSKIETSHVVGCNSAFVEMVETNLSEPFLLSPLENKEDTESMSTISDLANDRADGPEVISSKGDILELSISPKGSDDSLSLGCETPRECIFDPFAPGPGEAACAPKKKVTRGAEVPPRRKLNFDSGDFPVKRLSFDWSDSEEEYQYLQVIQNLILDLCISDSPLDRQEETANIMTDSSLCEGCMTPDSKPLLTGIASTCPDAPLRPSLKVSKLSPGVCRKIDFDAVSDSEKTIDESAPFD